MANKLTSTRKMDTCRAKFPPINQWNHANSTPVSKEGKQAVKEFQNNRPLCKKMIFQSSIYQSSIDLYTFIDSEAKWLTELRSDTVTTDAVDMYQRIVYIINTKARTAHQIKSVEKQRRSNKMVQQYRRQTKKSIHMLWCLWVLPIYCWRTSKQSIKLRKNLHHHHKTIARHK